MLAGVLLPYTAPMNVSKPKSRKYVVYLIGICLVFVWYLKFLTLSICESSQKIVTR